MGGQICYSKPFITCVFAFNLFFAKHQLKASSKQSKFLNKTLIDVLIENLFKFLLREIVCVFKEVI